jgi:hypothetical protein
MIAPLGAFRAERTGLVFSRKVSAKPSSVAASCSRRGSSTYRATDSSPERRVRNMSTSS